MSNIVIIAELEDGSSLRGTFNTDSPLELRAAALRSFLTDRALRAPGTLPELDVIALASGPEHRLFEHALATQGLDYAPALPEPVIDDVLAMLVDAGLAPDEIAIDHPARYLLAAGFAKEHADPSPEAIQRAVEATIGAWCAILFDFPPRALMNAQQATAHDMLSGAFSVAVPVAVKRHYGDTLVDAEIVEEA